MESSGSSTNSYDPHPYRWAEIMGACIALLTLTLPVFVIAYSSSSSSVDVFQQSSYSLTRSGK
ncbi:MAG: hypothetical protein F6K14_29525 [Symploca sp. SIO2C1]|nr:hypothetical protein [Symploca sp. SIO2C1]